MKEVIEVLTQYDLLQSEDGIMMLIALISFILAFASCTYVANTSKWIRKHLDNGLTIPVMIIGVWFGLTYLGHELFTPNITKKDVCTLALTVDRKIDRDLLAKDAGEDPAFEYEYGRYLQLVDDCRFGGKV